MTTCGTLRNLLSKHTRTRARFVPCDVRSHVIYPVGETFRNVPHVPQRPATSCHVVAHVRVCGVRRTSGDQRSQLPPPPAVGHTPRLPKWRAKRPPANEWFLPGGDSRSWPAGTATVLDTVCFLCPNNTSLQRPPTPCLKLTASRTIPHLNNRPARPSVGMARAKNAWSNSAMFC